MGIGSTIAGNVMGALGNIEKAQLVFHEIPEGQGVVTSDDTAFARSALGVSKLGLSRAQNALAGKAAMSQAQKVAARLEEEGDVLDVHFNPSSISIQAVGGGNAQIQVYGSNAQNKGQATFGKLESRVDVSFQLLFDATNRYDAFAYDKQTLTAQGGIELGKAVAGYEYTVLPQIEGLHAAIRIRGSAPIEFRWGALSFTGVITQLNTAYTMFSPTGNPIRAVANIRMTLIASENEAFLDSYDNLFATKGPVMTKSLGQTVKGLVNF